MAELFGRGTDGLGLSFTRLTVGASDFSTQRLQLRRHARERARSRASPFLDRAGAGNIVLPRVREALAINPDLLVMISPWSAPAWMKTTRSLIKGELVPQYYPAFANYLARTVQAFGARRRSGLDADDPERAQFRAGQLSRRARRSAPARGDHRPLRRPDCSSRAGSGRRSSIGTIIGTIRRCRSTVLADPVARQYISGVAWHCYEGDVAAQSPVHDAYPRQGCVADRMLGRRMAAEICRSARLDDRQAHHRRVEQLVARDLAVEPRARSRARTAHRRLRRLPGRRDDRSNDRRDHSQRRILCARPRQPVRPSRRLSRGRRASVATTSRRPPSSIPTEAASRSSTASPAKGPFTIAIDGERYTVALPKGSVATLRWSARSRRQVTSADQDETRTFLAFAAVTTLFFAWGFITSNNDPLIVALRAAFHLDYTEALLTQIVFFLAYGLLSLPAAWLTEPHRRGRHDPGLARPDGARAAFSSS